ncbi:LCP family protein [Fervidobacterium sp.]
MHTFLKITLAISLTIAITGLVFWLYFDTKISKINFTVEFSAEDVGAYSSNYNKSQETFQPKQKNNRFAIALFGVDAHEDGENSRSDTIMLLFIDHNEKTIKLVSIMRDTYIEVPGFGKRKINSAYQLGGPKLALTTININFKLPLTKYITIDFAAFEKVVDALGGVEVEIKPYELENFNNILWNLKKVLGGDVKEISSPGVHHLNGRQALAYSRIRQVGNGDYERVQRQQKIFEQIFEKTKRAPIGVKLTVIDAILPYIETNMKKSEIISLASKNYAGYSLERMRLPIEGSYQETYATIDGLRQWIFDVNLDMNTQSLHKFIEN